MPASPRSRDLPKKCCHSCHGSFLLPPEFIVFEIREPFLIHDLRFRAVPAPRFDHGAMVAL